LPFQQDREVQEVQAAVWLDVSLHVIRQVIDPSSAEASVVTLVVDLPY
jgi:hypothetical protein